MVGRAREERSRKFLCQLLRAQHTALRLSKDRDRNGRVKPLVEETLMRRSVPDATYKNDPVSPQALLSDAEPPEGWLQKGEHHGCQPLLP
jgi:hypothetical protein